MRYCLLVFLIFTSQVLAQVSRRMDEVVNDYVMRQQFSGTVLVARAGRIIHHRGYGLAHRGHNVACHTDTRYRIGDITQSLTAVLICQLIQARKLQATTRVAQVLREYQGFDMGSLTIDQLLHHTSGLPCYSQTSTYQRRQRDALAPPQLIEMVQYMPLRARPGTAFYYSRSNYVLLGMVAERVTGQQYEHLLREALLHPTSMQGSGLNTPSEVVPNLATGYLYTQGRYTLPPYTEAGNALAQGGLYATALDLYQFSFTIDLGSLLNDAQRTELFKPELAGYACGWLVQRVPDALLAEALVQGPAFDASASSSGRVLQWHWGSAPGFRALCIRLPQDEGLVVLLCNQEYTDGSTPTHLAALAAQLIAQL